MMKFTQFAGVAIALAIDEFTITAHGGAALIAPLEIFTGGRKSNRRHGRSHARKCRASTRRGGHGRSHGKRCP